MRETIGKNRESFSKKGKSTDWLSVDFLYFILNIFKAKEG